jgi:outer membrane receptor protein involved in Fe transport
LEALGNRQSDTDSDSKVINFGVRGDIGNTGWNWETVGSYSRLDQNNHVTGYLFKPDLKLAVGPSFYAGPGATNPTCGTVTVPIPGCIPLDIFNVTSTATLPALNALNTDYFTTGSFITEGFSATVNGAIFDLPAGPVQTAIGVEYRSLEGKFFADHLVVATPPLFISCLISQEACTGNSRGDYNVREIYFEGFVPILKDMTGAQALNASVGVRYSDYSMFDAKTRAELKVEYRPVTDLLIRGTYAQVYRVPTINDLFGAPAISNPTFADPCLHLTAAQVAANPHLSLACKGVATDGSFAGDGTSQITSVILSNPAVKPETGTVLTYGFVYDMSFVKGLSFSVDVWQYKIDDLISNIDTNYSMNQCVSTGSPYFCGLINRYTSGPNSGRIAAFIQPTTNLGSLETSGIDFGIKYALRETPIGAFNFTLDMTHITKYDSKPAPDVPTQEVVGTFDKQFGNIAQWRGLLGIGWSYDSFDALLTGRYVHSLEVPHADGADPFNSPSLPIPSVVTFDISAGYNFEGTKTRIQAGVQNVGDKQPPLFYQNNVINANTDVSTYDSLGRRWFVNIKQKF